MNVPEWGEGDITAISELAIEAYTAYKHAPDDHRHISEEVLVLQTLINKVAQHFKGTTISNSDRHHGQDVLMGSQGVLKDLISLVEKYKSLDSTNEKLVFNKLGEVDIEAIQLRLISNTTTLGWFVRSCENLEIQARLNAVLGLRHKRFNVPITSIASFVENINKAYEQFYKDLYGIGVTQDMMQQKRKEVLEIFCSHNTVANLLIEDQDNDPNTTKVEARVQSLASNDTLVEAMDTKSDTPLHLAAQNGHVDIVELLLKEVSPIDAINQDGNTPLHLAAWYGGTGVVELLLRKGALIAPVNEESNTPLHFAARAGHIDVVELLLGKGASIDAVTINNDTPLHLAAWKGHIGVVELLLRKGAPIGAINQYGNTPLHLAVLDGHTDAVELLLRNGASTEHRNRYGNTPLHLAAQEGYIDIVRLLNNNTTNSVVHSVCNPKSKDWGLPIR